jgi:DNA-binding HxlR family transcriptional regulator
VNHESENFPPAGTSQPARGADRYDTLARAIDVLGDRWVLLIMREALDQNSTRFMEFMRALDIPSNVLTARLNKLVSIGVLERQASRVGRSPHEYRTTELGERLRPVLAAIATWGAIRPDREGRSAIGPSKQPPSRKPRASGAWTNQQMKGLS